MTIPPITGQLLLWNKGPGPISGKNMVQVFGVLGLPASLAEEFCRDEYLKHMVFGQKSVDGLRLDISQDVTEPLPEYYTKGQTPDRLFTSPIWRM